MSIYTADQVFKVVTNGWLLGQRISNTWWYSSPAALATADALGNAFIFRILDRVANCVSDSMYWETVEVSNMGDAENAVLLPTGMVGRRSTAVSSTFTAIGLRFYPEVIHFRSGAKRLAGLADADDSMGEPSGTLSLLIASLCTELEKTLIAADFTTYHLVVKGDAGLPVGNFTIWRDIASATFRWITTQNTRKVGRGV